jgi:hypothetical protein
MEDINFSRAKLTFPPDEMKTLASEIAAAVK